jgi:DNA-binding beta-propeller fold protein YncE
MTRSATALALAMGLTSPAVLAGPSLQFDFQWTYRDGAFDEAAAEIVAYDPAAKEVYVVNGANNRVDVLDQNGTFLRSLSVGGFGQPNSVAVKNGVVAVAVGATTKTDNGKVFFFDTLGNKTGEVAVGALPDMVTFTPDGKKVLVANEGEPDFYGTGGTDPEGSVAIIDISGGATDTAPVTSATFTGFDKAALVSAGVRITGPGATAAQDIEPEYISVSPDGTKAFVTLQENNAVAEIDLTSGTVAAIRPLGLKDHSQPGNGLDASDRDGPGNDGRINIQTWPIKGMYMPDSIASYSVNGQTYYLTANEGDTRDYSNPNNTADNYTDEVRVGNGAVTLDASVFDPADDLKNNDNLGRYNMSRVDLGGNVPSSYTEILGFGARSFSIWNAADGTLVWDSGDDFEQITAVLGLTDQDGNPVFNSSNDANDSFDTRSDNKGPEPEALTIGEIEGFILAFVGLERIGGIMVYDITDPASPTFLTYLLNRDFGADPETAAAGDLGPEGLYFIPKDLSWTGNPMLLVANEISGTTTAYDMTLVPSPATLALFAAGLPLLVRRRRAGAAR